MQYAGYAEFNGVEFKYGEFNGGAHFSVYDWKYPFWSNVVQKIKASGFSCFNQKMKDLIQTTFILVSLVVNPGL